MARKDAKSLEDLSFHSSRRFAELDIFQEDLGEKLRLNEPFLGG